MKKAQHFELNFETAIDEGLREFRTFGKTWRDLAREEQIRPDDCDTFVIRGGRGCVAGETLIYDPSTELHQRIDVLASEGRPTWVMSLEGPVLADAPFLKGSDRLFSITMADHSEVKVTSAHKFLCPSGWRQMQQCAIGDLVAVSLAPQLAIQPASPASLVSSLDTCPSELPVNGPRWLHKELGSRDRYLSGPGRYGQRLLLVGDIGRCVLPSPGGARERSHLLSRMDALEKAQECSRLCPSCGLPCRSGSALDELFLAAAEYQRRPSPAEQILHSAREYWQSLLSNVTQLIHATAAQGDANFPSNEACECTCNQPIRWERIVSRREIGIADYYDLHVPGPNNYLANGIWHHNSGKTRAGAEDFLERMRSMDAPYMHMLAPTRDEVKKVMIEGISGILRCARPGEVVRYNKSELEVEFSNGVISRGFGGESPERLNGPQCFIAGTRVATPSGSLPIEDIVKYDLVLTREGWKTVIGTASRYAEVGRVEFDNGSFLLGTPDHLVCTSGGWMRMDHLTKGDQVCAISGENRSAKNAGNPLSPAPAITVVNVASTWRRSGERVVYCLQVDEQHEFFANGILVHNCGHLWGDEFYNISVHAIQQARLGNRIGRRVTATYTSTPKPGESTDYVLALPDAVVRRMRTSDNVDNLSPRIVAELYEEFRGTRQERVELEGELDIDMEGALWKARDFEGAGFRRRAYNPAARRTWEEQNGIGLMQIVVALDPTVADNELKDKPFKKQDEAGIIVAGSDHRGHGYTLADLSMTGSPDEWCEVAIKAYNEFGADMLVYETNQGGMLIRDALRVWAAKLADDRYLRNSDVKLVPVRAFDSKGVRAEPLQMLYAQGRWHHCNDSEGVDGPRREKLQKAFEKLEREMLTWNALDARTRRKSPNRIDASVIAAHALKLVTAYDVRKRRMFSTGRQ